MHARRSKPLGNQQKIGEPADRGKRAKYTAKARAAAAVQRAFMVMPNGDFSTVRHHFPLSVEQLE